MGRKDDIKRVLINYAKSLKSAYLGGDHKKKIKSEMVKLNKELRLLEKKEAIAKKRNEIVQIKTRISKLNATTTTRLDKGLEIPDMIGKIKFSTGTELNLPGGGKIKRYF
jgi:hypothetical protein